MIPKEFVIGVVFERMPSEGDVVHECAYHQLEGHVGTLQMLEGKDQPGCYLLPLPLATSTMEVSG